MYKHYTPVEQVDMTFYYILGISIVVLIGITIAMIYFVIRYHYKRNPVATQIRGHVGLEILWTVIPSLIALSMFYFGWISYLDLRKIPKDALEIQVSAEMFNWFFGYQEGKESQNELVVPVGRAIKLNITSEDVLHGFFLPAYRIKMDAVPKMTTNAWFYADKEGEYDIFCTVYCGVGHSGMHAKLKIVSKEDYERWLKGESLGEKSSNNH
ncbi:MAG: cytochrome c oxidase subunit II [Oligoflexia bacterium]|nr:cytochrome c oxidase subunit II [Oligoflexia bacterium]MBF0367035.1 cytochrome c oxidase subunit II [Oligoflexia bacterium]